MKLDGDRRCLELAVDTATLDAAPGIDRANPPETRTRRCAHARLRAVGNRPHAIKGETMGGMGDAISYTVLALGFVVLIFLGALFFVQASRRGNRRFKWCARYGSAQTNRCRRRKR